MSYTDVFGNVTLPPSEYGYRTATLTSDVTLFWPENTTDASVSVAKIMDVSCASGNSIILPDATLVSTGEDFLIRNVGANALSVKKSDGTPVYTVSAGAAVYFYLTDNSTPAGVYGTVAYGVGTSYVDAATLVGYGIKAVSGTLNQSHPVTTSSANITIDDTYRAKLLNFNGGAGTLSLASASTLGDDFFFLLRNSGTGTLTIDPSGSQTIDGQTTMQIQPSESLMLFCSGSAWYSVGYGRSTLYQFTQLVKDVTTGSPFTLTSTEASNKLITFIGTPSATVTVNIPSVVSVYYLYNSCTTAQSVTFKTAAGTGISVPQSGRVIALCDGTNVISAQSVTVSSTVSLIDGTVTNPALNFASQTNTGLYKYSTAGLGVAASGTDVAEFESTRALITVPQDYSKYSTSLSAPTHAEGTVFYDNTDHTLAYYNDATGVTVNIGQEEIVRVRNNTGSTLNDGQVVYVNGALGDRPTVALAKADAEATSAGTIGIVTAPITNNTDGYITTAGLIHGLDTSAITAGSAVYLSPSTAGAFTATKPTAPNHMVVLGYVTRSHATQGIIYVRVDNGYELDELHNVLITSATNNNGLVYESATSLWKNKPVALTGVANTFTTNQIIDVNTSSDALRITQSGAGNALVVEDSANPDSTPFVIDTSGNVLIGRSSTADNAPLEIYRATGANIFLKGDAGTNIVAYRGSADANGPLLQLGKARNTSGAPQSVVQNDAVGIINFYGHDGTNYINAARVDASVDGTPGTNDMPGRLVFSTTADGASTPTERMRIDSAGGVGIGGSSLTGVGLRIQKAMTGSTTVIGGSILATVQSDATTLGVGWSTSLSTQAAAFTLTRLDHFSAFQGTVGAGSTITSQVGFRADSSLTGATNNYGFYSDIASGTGRWNFYAAGTANNYFAGAVGIGVTPSSDTLLTVAGTYPTFGTNSFVQQINGTSPSGTTNVLSGYRARMNTAAASFTLSAIRVFDAGQGTIGAGSTVTTQYGFYADSSLTGAANNYGFFGNIASGTGRYNLYMAGTADNYLAGNLLVGYNATPVTGTNITVQGTSAGVATVRYNDTSTLASYLNHYRSRGSTIGTPSAVQSGDMLGRYTSYGYNGTSASYVASTEIKSEVDAAPGASDMPGRLVFMTTAVGGTGVTERMRIDSAGSVGIGTTPLAGRRLEVRGNVTGSANASGVMSGASVQSDVTSTFNSFVSFPSTQAAAFTLVQLRHFAADQNTFGAGSTVTNQYGYYAASSLTGATNNYGFYSDITSGTGRYNLYMAGTADNYLAGSLGLGTAPNSTVTVEIGKNITGATTAYGIRSLQTVQSDVTTTAYVFISNPSTAAASFTMSGGLQHFAAFQGTIGAGSTVNNQYGFHASSSLTGATNNYGFYGNIAAGTGRYNLYMNGTADNYMGGALGIGSTSVIGYTLRISKDITGATSSFGVLQNGTVQSDVTNSAISFRSIQNTQATTFTLPAFTHFVAEGGTVGAGSTVTNQYGFSAGSDLTNATNNYGFFSNIAAGNNRWNFYAAATANNYFAGTVVKAQGAPASFAAAGTLTAANALTRIITTSGTTYSLTLDTGTNYESGIVSWPTDGSIDFSIINTASGTITVATATGWTLVGTMTVTTGTSAQFRVRKTATNTFTLYRIS